MSTESARKPGQSAEALFHQGNRLRAEGRNADAEAAFRAALAARPAFAEAELNLGHLCELSDRLDEAFAWYERAAAHGPGLADAWQNLGNICCKRQRFAEAETAYRRALDQRPDWAVAWLNLGNALRMQQRLEDAIAAYRRVVALRPDSADGHVNLAHAYRALNRLDEARAECARALALNPASPEAHLNAAMVHLVAGDYRAGWPHAEYRHALKLGGAGREFRQPQWKGHEPLAGRCILLHGEQGFGDTLQFVRFAPLVAARGARVILEVQPALRDLLAATPGMDSVQALGSPLPEFDLHCPLPSLPLALGIELASLPRQVPYVEPPAGRVARWKDRLGAGPGPTIGFAWSGNPSHPNDFNRSIPSERFGRIFDGVGGARLVCLKREVAAGEMALLAGRPNVSVPAAELADFADTAALVSQLDLVLAVDTSVAHLAGALGRPVWVLLPFAPDWRWLLDREDSPWYPTARLFRQPRLGDWDSVIEQVRRELGFFLARP